MIEEENKDRKNDVCYFALEYLLGYKDDFLFRFGFKLLGSQHLDTFSVFAASNFFEDSVTDKPPRPVQRSDLGRLRPT